MEYYIHYTDTEHLDAQEIDRANELVQAQKWGEAKLILEPIAGRSPQLYVYSFETDAELFIKFWDLAEYLGYMGMTRKLGETPEQETIWLKAAYPRAHYLLARVDMAKKDFASAAEHLDLALQMEPDHPLCLCDMAVISALTGDAEQALDYCDMTLQARPYLSGPTKLKAQKLKVQMLTHLGRTDEAHRVQTESFLTSPQSPVEENVEAYRKSFESGDNTAPVGLKIDNLEPLPTGPSPYDQIEENSETQELPEIESPTPAEPDTTPVRKKRWWQIWKR